jgi:outer membrane protein TolC
VSVAKLHTGSATRSDSLRSLVTLGNARLDQLTTQTDLAAAEANLARLIGETGRVKAADDSAFYAPVPQLDATGAPSRGRIQVSPGSERPGQRSSRQIIGKRFQIGVLANSGRCRRTPTGVEARAMTTTS